MEPVNIPKNFLSIQSNLFVKKSKDGGGGLGDGHRIVVQWLLGAEVGGCMNGCVGNGGSDDMDGNVSGDEGSCSSKVERLYDYFP